eukprot:gene11111-17080_t
MNDNGAEGYSIELQPIDDKDTDSIRSPQSPEVRADDVRLCSPSSVCFPSSTSHIPVIKLTDTARGSTGAAAGDYEAAQADAPDEVKDLQTNYPAARPSRAARAAAAAVCLALLAAAALLAYTVARETPETECFASIPSLGRVRGHQQRRVQRYTGVPYAQPPAPWTSPRPVSPWAGTLDATQRAPACINLAGVGSLDCLYLDIYTPTDHGDELLPVLVWIHGGCYGYGATADYDGSHFVRQSGVVVVVIAYRLGVYGFLGGGEEGLTGWYGIDDQRVALEWVRDHISAFAGDPARVTVSGQSSGAGSVGLHYVSPGSRGLFRSAIMHSAAFAPWTVTTQAAAKQQYFEILDLANCSSLTCLGQLDPALLANITKKPQCSDGCTYSPPVDGYNIVDNPHQMIIAGNHSGVAVLHGNCRDDGALYAGAKGNMTPGDWDAWVDHRFPEPSLELSSTDTVRPQVIQRPGGLSGVLGALFPPGLHGSLEEVANCSATCKRAVEVETHYSYVCPSTLSGAALADQGVPVWEFLFARDPRPERPFTDHSCGLPYLWYAVSRPC